MHPLNSHHILGVGHLGHTPLTKILLNQTPTLKGESTLTSSFIQYAQCVAGVYTRRNYSGLESLDTLRH